MRGPLRPIRQQRVAEEVGPFHDGDELVEQTYERSQFVNHRLPNKGDRLAVYVHVAQLPPQPGKESLATEVSHEPENDWRTPIKGDVQA